MATPRIGIIGDFDPDSPTHRATNEAIGHSLAQQGCKATVEWLPTDQMDDFSKFAGLWCSPGSPYRSLEGALAGIGWARRNQTPFIGTCGGFQHALLEFARSVLRIKDAMHAEYDPYASVLFVRPLACSLVGQTLPIRLKEGTRAARLYGSSQAVESYHCNFGLNAEYHEKLEAAGMTISGWDDNSEARIVELEDHPFFLATLFVPQTKSTPEEPHPLISAFIARALAKERATGPTLVR